MNLEIRNEGNEAAEVLLYSPIGSDYGGIDAKTFTETLGSLADRRLTVRINSPGGSVFDGLAMYNAIMRHPRTVNVAIDGLAASAASIVAMAGKTIRMAENSFLMIHKAWGLVVGNADDLRSTAEQLERIDGQLAATYAKRSGGSADKFAAMMAAETWFTADEALAAGLVDKVDQSRTREQPAEPAAFARWSYGATPQDVSARWGIQRDEFRLKAPQALAEPMYDAEFRAREIRARMLALNEDEAKFGRRVA